jgi:hypothetical protein
MTMRFSTTLALQTKTATCIRVSDEVLEALGPAKRPPVRVTVGDYTYSTRVAVMGGQNLIPVSADVRERAGIAAGDELDVHIELDAEPREVVLPEDLAAAIGGDPLLEDAFARLAPGRKRQLVLSVEGAKKPETRLRRIAGAVEDLRSAS